MSIQNTTTLAGSAAVVVPRSEAGRNRSVLIQNRSGADVFVGGSDVTTDTAATGGYKVADGETIGFVVPPGVEVYAHGTGAVTVLDLEQS